MKAKLHIFLALLTLLAAETFCSELVARVKEELEGFSPGEGGSPAMPNDPVSSPVPNPAAGPPSDADISATLKPVCFLNTGTVSATVKPWTYATPGSDTSVPASSTASTVAFPGGNSSACLSLPLGTYTWCYSWELGDINDDSMIEYAHYVDERSVVLDESDNDNLDMAETVNLSVPMDTGMSFGICGLDFAPFVVAQKHVDRLSGAYIGLAHDTDSVTLRGPITFMWWYVHAEVDITAGVPTETTTPEVVSLATEETMTFELVERRDDHPGDWNLYIWLLSVDE